MTVTVVTAGDPEPAPPAPQEASVAFAAGLATAEAAQATETAQEAEQAAAEAAAAAQLAVDIAASSAGQCCQHCEAYGARIEDLDARLTTTQDTAVVALEEATEPAPEPVQDSAPVHHTEPAEEQYGSAKWFGRR